MTIFPGPGFAFSPVSPEAKELIVNLPPGKETLRWAEGMVEALREVEMSNPSFSAPPPPEIRVAAWNLHQCHYPREAAELLAANHVDIALLNEVDIGLHRSGQRHTLALLSENLAHLTGIPRGYGAGVEFYELVAADNPEDPGQESRSNHLGFQGNGWLTRFRTRRPALIRLSPQADWFVNPLRNQRRVGGRMAVAAVFEFGHFELVGAAAQLEFNTGPVGRKRQMRELLEALDDFAGRRPVVLGGSFNPDDAPEGHGEGLFREAERRGYQWREVNTSGPTSLRKTTGTVEDGGGSRHDWFFVKGIEGGQPGVVAAVDGGGRSISDHDAILLSLAIPPER